ncbi:putative sensor histidine kinase [Desulfovibrio sp. DV]|uniref:sensor histidine kinase n=1 Tax=Desulfovibrio sp. DV TaxID=1844708 RepID=UPI00094B9E45|nr:HAMP domain-containing sensor histidine kinase [Desulfovibrio sp. DV]OLN29226.1 putative sensor histidine kinase [Desulfovibrio sp. DV]
MPDETPTTFFLPAERLDQTSIERISREIARSPSAVTLSLMPLAILIINDTRQIVYANARFLSLANLTDENDVIGLRIGEALGCEHADDNAGGCGTTRFCQYCGAAQAVVKSLEGDRGTQECSISRTTSTTLEALNLQVWAVPMVIEGHKLVINSILDIAHEKALRGFERIFFHDIINAVTGIKGIHDIMAFDLPVDYTAELDLLRRAIDDIQDIVETQRDFLAVETKEYRNSFSWIETREVLTYLAAYCQAFNPGGKRRLVVAPETVARTFSSDARIIQRIMVNMIKNALEASAPGECVTIGCDAPNGTIVFWVHNPGALPEETQMRIFEKGYSTKGEGRGFGTYSMRLFARQCLGADVRFTSACSAGTRFELVVPV